MHNFPEMKFIRLQITKTFYHKYKFSNPMIILGDWFISLCAATFEKFVYCVYVLRDTLKLLIMQT